MRVVEFQMLVFFAVAVALVLAVVCAGLDLEHATAPRYRCGPSSYREFQPAGEWFKWQPVVPTERCEP